jgi:hypothetical protein
MLSLEKAIDECSKGGEGGYFKNRTERIAKGQYVGKRGSF